MMGGGGAGAGGGSGGIMSMLTGMLGGGGGGGGSAPPPNLVTVPESLGSSSIMSPDLSGLAASAERQMNEASVVTPENEQQALLRGGIKYGGAALSAAMGGKTGSGMSPTGGNMGWMNLPSGAGYGPTQQVGGSPGRSYPVVGGRTVGGPVSSLSGLGALF